MESIFGIKAHNEYGLGELLGPNMACECERQEGLHVWSDHILAECVDPDSGEWVPEGEEGELVCAGSRRFDKPRRKMLWCLVSFVLFNHN